MTKLRRSDDVERWLGVGCSAGSWGLAWLRILYHLTMTNIDIMIFSDDTAHVFLNMFYDIMITFPTDTFELRFDS